MYLPSEPQNLKRHFVSVGDASNGFRQVHFRMSGPVDDAGNPKPAPIFLLLHQSPTSSAEIADQVVEFAKEFWVIAPDRPGYGLSDPIECGKRPDMKIYADATVAFLDALGVDKCAVYGTHTGAVEAAELGRAYPDRFSAVLLDGYVVLTPEERTEFLEHYFADFAPAHDGSHLMGLWYRIRDQVIFFPWYKKLLSHRMKFDVPPPEFLELFFADLMRAGDNANRAYYSAFAYDADKKAQEIQVPTYLMNYEADAIADHPERMSKIEAPLIRRRYPDPAALHADAVDIVGALTDVSLGPIDVPKPKSGSSTLKDYVMLAGKRMFVRRSVSFGAAPMLYIHDVGESSATAVWQGLECADGAIMPDLFGFGETGGAMSDNAAADLKALVDHLGVSKVRLVGAGFGGHIALEFAADYPDMVENISLVDPHGGEPADMEKIVNCMPSAEKHPSGSHLIDLWHWVRDRQLFYPANEPMLDKSLTVQPDLTPEFTHQKLQDYLKSGNKACLLANCLAKRPIRGLVLKLDQDITIIDGRGGPALRALVRNLADSGINFLPCDNQVALVGAVKKRLNKA